MNRTTCLAAMLGIALVAGCESTSAVPETGPEPKAMRTHRVSRETLANHGLEEVWYLAEVQARGRAVGVQNVFLTAEGLFLVTSPPLGPSGDRLLEKHLIRMEPVTGETRWYETIETAAVYPPVGYQYPTSSARDSELFLLQGDRVVCLDLEGGQRMWDRELPMPASTGLCASDAALFVGSENQRIVAVDKNAKVESWTYWTQSRVEATPVLFGDLVVAASHDGGVRGLSLNSGWDPNRSWEFMTGAKIRATPRAFGRYLFVGSTDYKLYCLRQNGSAAWSFQAEAPIIDDPVIYRVAPNREICFVIADADLLDRTPRRLFAVPLPKGDEAARVDAAWHFDGVRKVVSIGRDSVYVLLEPSSRGERLLAAIDVQSGEERFTIDLAGFNFVPTNEADFGRDNRLRGVIHLVSESGEIQVLREKLK